MIYNWVSTSMKLISIGFIVLLISAMANAQTDAGNKSVGTFPKPTDAQGIEEWKPHVGVIAGFADPEGRFQSAAEYGLDVGFQPYIPFGLGMELSSSSNEIEDAGTSEDLTRTKLLMKGTYNFGGNIVLLKDSFVGLGAGPIFESFLGDDNIYLGVMPVVGFDIPLQEKAREYLSLGLNAKYLISSGGGPDTFSMNGIVKYWF